MFFNPYVVEEQLPGSQVVIARVPLEMEPGSACSAPLSLLRVGHANFEGVLISGLLFYGAQGHR